MAIDQKPGWHKRGYIPHFDCDGVLQHVVLSGTANIDLTMPQLAKLIEDSLLYHDGTKYDLQTWVIMPDHVHIGLIFYPSQPMGKMVWTWKKWIGGQGKLLKNPVSNIFQVDYFDRYIRSLDQAERLPAYIENNPVKAGLALTACDWRWSSAWHRTQGWRPNHERLPVFLPSLSR